MRIFQVYTISFQFTEFQLMLDCEKVAEMATSKATFLTAYDLPCDPVEEIVRPVVRCLKEAGKIALCPCETFWIRFILQKENICSRMGNIRHNMA